MLLDPNNCRFELYEVLRFSRKAKQSSTTKRDFAVLSCRLSGQTVFYDDGGKTLASPEDFVLIPAGLDYMQKSGDEEIICIHLRLEGLHAKKICGFHTASPLLRQYFISLHKLWQAKESGYLLRCNGIVFDILFELYRLSDKAAPSRDMLLLAPAVSYIREHYTSRDFSLPCAIDKAFVSPAYFRRLFKSAYGMTPNRFVNSLRIDYAKILMESQMLSLREIAETCGFSNEKYFFTVFKSLTGTTPTAWQQAQKK